MAGCVAEQLVPKDPWDSRDLLASQVHFGVGDHSGLSRFVREFSFAEHGPGHLPAHRIYERRIGIDDVLEQLEFLVAPVEYLETSGFQHAVQRFLLAALADRDIGAHGATKQPCLGSCLAPLGATAKT